MDASQGATQRRQLLEQFVEKHPQDAFGRYGLAMECLKENDVVAAEVHFRQLANQHPEYVATYYQYGRMLAAANRISEARAIFSAGIDRARQAGEVHAREELQAALDELI